MLVPIYFPLSSLLCKGASRLQAFILKGQPELFSYKGAELDAIRQLSHQLIINLLARF